uniref:Uncharacterized protein n=1 Tax=Romanomermis culicivorax TaxID=13658 RepID=A0A915JJT1_ROMCU
MQLTFLLLQLQEQEVNCPFKHTVWKQDLEFKISDDGFPHLNGHVNGYTLHLMHIGDLQKQIKTPKVRVCGQMELLALIFLMAHKVIWLY